MTKDLFLKYLYSQGGKSDLEFNNIKGRVKRIVETTFTATATMDGYKQGDLLAGSEVVFDDCGNIIIEKKKEKVDYGAQIDLHECVLASLQGDDRSGSVRRAEDAAAEIKRLKKKQKAEPFSEVECRYIYSAGLCVEKRSEDNIEQYEYDEDSNLIAGYDLQFKYDSNGKMIKCCDTNESDECNKLVIEHSDNGFVAKGWMSYYLSGNDSNYYNGDPLKTTLNPKGKVTESHSFETKKVLFIKKEILLSSETFRYNPQGDVSSYTINSFDKENGDTVSTTKHRYQYDEAGNWTEKLGLNTEGDTITIRQIEYFE